MTEPSAERCYQDGQLQAERDNSRGLTVCPMPEGTDEAKWWHRGYDHMVLLQDRGRAMHERRDLGFARQRITALEEQVQAITRRYEVELAELRGYLKEKQEFQARAKDMHDALDRLKGLVES